MICQKCNTSNPEEQNFCGACGTKLEPIPVVTVPGEEGAFYCARHTKVVTRLRCGRCEKPICPRCTVFGPAGARCRECSKHRVPIRPRGVLHEAGRTVDRNLQGGGGRVWYLVIWYAIVSFISNIFGGGRDG